MAAHHSEEEQGTFPALADLDTTRDQAQRSYSGKVLHKRFLLFCESAVDSYELARVLSCAGRMAVVAGLTEGGPAEVGTTGLEGGIQAVVGAASWVDPSWQAAEVCML